MLTFNYRLSDDEISALEGKSLVESDALRDLGIRSGALKPSVNGEDNFVVLENRGFHRICAPQEGQTNRATAVIIWQKDSPGDANATPEKIVGPRLVVVVSWLILQRVRSEPLCTRRSSSARPFPPLKSTTKPNFASHRTFSCMCAFFPKDCTDSRPSEKENIDRPRLIDDGKMAKGLGPQSSHGIPYFMQVRVFPLSQYS